MIRTSESHPLRIDTLRLTNGARIGMTLCPGKHQDGALSGNWRRDLQADIDVIGDTGAKLLVTLFEDFEFDFLQVRDLPEVAAESGLEWLHLPIVDQRAPDASFETAWKAGAAKRLHQMLDAGDMFVLHCMGGLGRTGTIAARLLIERDESAENAISRVRNVRKRAIETPEQQHWLHAYESSPDRVRWPG